LTLTFDPAIRHIVLQQSSTSTYIPTFIQIEETFCGRTDVRTDRRTYVRTGGRTFFPSILLGRLSEVDLIIKGHRPLSECKGNYSAMLSNMKLVHWPLISGLLHLVQQRGDWAGGHSPPKAPSSLYPNVTAHPSMASVAITIKLCSFNMPIEGLTSHTTHKRST